MCFAQNVKEKVYQMAKPGYKERVIEHSLMWVNGNPQHNDIDDECLHDFSCCFPDLFEPSLAIRQTYHLKLIECLNTDSSATNKRLDEK